MSKVILFFATGTYLGYLPIAPGTFGTLWGLPLAWALTFASTSMALIILLVAILAATWVSARAQVILERHDPGLIVIDEVVGMAVALWGLEWNLKTVVVGFLLFRLADIVKPPPIRQIDNAIKGGLGVVLDDVAAGVLVNLLLRLMVVANLL
jgi:phosphatidylglycerophosphatase A